MRYAHKITHILRISNHKSFNKQSNVRDKTKQNKMKNEKIAQIVTFEI